MKIVALYSGGLDSTLVLSHLESWNAEVYPLHLTHQFLVIKALPGVTNLKVIDITDQLLETVRHPKHGYGRNLNPCIDCRVLMLEKAREYLREIKGDFIVTGEVLDQRPLSQRLDALMTIDRYAGVEGMVVRPLSGGLLPATVPEKQGLIKREQLLQVRGRSRRLELAIAKRLRVNDYFSPSGGCLLTDPGFCRRLADLMRYQPDFAIREIELLKLGRHFRIAPDAKVIVGRNKDENEELSHYIDAQTFLLSVPDTGSPNSLLLGAKKHLKVAAAITARYSDEKEKPKVAVQYENPRNKDKVDVAPALNEDLDKWRIV